MKTDASKVFIPHCTILYRCGNDTGCCNTDTQICVEKTFENIDLYFYVNIF